LIDKKILLVKIDKGQYKNANGGIHGILFTSRLGLRVAAGIRVEEVFGSNQETKRSGLET
jgi:hypothetical protein